jgi:1,4-dihydroxy-2-naphthoate octaprenyltransferase
MRNQLNIWIQALRLKTLPLALGGIIAGFAISQSNNYVVLSWACLTAILLQILSNFANDYGDFIKGTDRHRADRLMNTGKIQPSEMKWAIVTLAILSLISGLTLLYIAQLNSKQWWVFLGMGILAIIAAITYTVGKKAYGYLGFGDLFVFLFFGLVAVLGGSYLFSPEISFKNWIIAAGYGLLATGVLNINNLRDIEKDKNNGKFTLVTKLGYRNGIRYHFALILGAMACYLFYGMNNLGSWFLLTFGVIHLYKILKVSATKDYNLLLKQLSLTAFFSVLALLIQW